MMIDNIITDVPNKFIYLIIGLLVLYISTRIIKANISHIFALIVGFFIISRLDQQSSNDVLTFNQVIDTRYKTIGMPTNFYIDANLINLYFSIYKWKNLNPHNYTESIKAVNNVLSIELENKTKNCANNYEIAFEQSKIALNMMHGFIYNIDKPLLVEKLKKILSRLQQLLARHLKIIKDDCEKDQKIDINTKFIQDINQPKPFDKYTNFDFY